MDSTLAKGLAVIEWLARQQRDCRVTDVAQAFGLARSNAHRTLQTLVECGWAVQDRSTSAYRASLRLFELGTLISDAADIKTLVRPHLALLAQATGETIHLATLEGADPAALEALPGVTAVEVAGTRVHVLTTDSDAVARHLLVHTAAHDLEVTGRSLEDAFVALTTDTTADTTTDVTTA